MQKINQANDANEAGYMLEMARNSEVGTATLNVEISSAVVYGINGIPTLVRARYFMYSFPKKLIRKSSSSKKVQVSIISLKLYGKLVGFTHSVPSY